MDRSQVEEIVSRRLCDVETALPAKVTSVAKDGSLSVMMLIKKVTVDGIVDTENRVIEGIRPLTIGNSSASIEVEIGVGAHVLLVGLSRHAREWLGTKSDDAVIPKSAYGNMLNDLVAVPLFRGDRENGKNAKISLGEDGTVEVTSTFGQTLKFDEDGSIVLTPKSGSKVTIKGDVEIEGGVSCDDDVVANAKLPLAVSLVSHTHNYMPGTGPLTPTTTPAPAPST